MENNDSNYRADASSRQSQEEIDRLFLAAVEQAFNAARASGSQTIPVVATNNIELTPPAPPVHRNANEHRCPTCNQMVQIKVDLNRKCPQCNKQVVIRKNRTSGNDFIGCSGYPNCRWTMSVRRYLLWTEGTTPQAGEEEGRKMFI